MRIRFASLALIGTAVLAAGCSEGVELPDQADTGSAPRASAEKLPTGIRLDPTRRTLKTEDGRSLRIDPELVTGYVDSAVVNGAYLDMSGWAAPADLSEPAGAVVAIAGRRASATVAPSRERQDLVDGYDRPGLANAGFVMSIPRKSLDCSEPDQGLAVYGVTEDAAGELEWLADVPDVVKEAC